MNEKKMKNLSNAIFPEARKGSIVQMYVPNVDRGREDPRLVIAVVPTMTEEELYQY